MYQTNSCFRWNLILSSYFDIDCFDCMIDNINFVRNFVNFFEMEIVLDSLICKVIVV